jgi:peptidoglycan-N-acetylglucosamine deacetylase
VLADKLKLGLKRALATHRLPTAGHKRILFTFDDGPHPELTPRILDQLDDVGARAVFFVIGRLVAQYPQLVREIARRGHLLGNHSFSHGRVLSPARAYAEVRYCQLQLAEVVGLSSRLYRPPRGTLVSPTVLFAKALGMTTVLWSIDPKDAGIRSAEIATRRGAFLADCLNRPERRSDIVLLHDASPHTPTLLKQLFAQLSPCDLTSGASALDQSPWPSLKRHSAVPQ